VNASREGWILLLLLPIAAGGALAAGLFGEAEPSPEVAPLARAAPVAEPPVTTRTPTEAVPDVFAASDVPEAGPAPLFQYHWEDDGGTEGLATRAHVNQPRRIWVGEQLVEVDSGAEFALQREYGIVLSGEADPWTPEHASRLLDAMRALRPPGHAGAVTTASTWLLVGRLPDDIALEPEASGLRVQLSGAAFELATPRRATLEGRRGRYYSKRLRHAVVRFVTRNGQDPAAAERILVERFGVSTQPDYARLTASTTRETATRFQPFRPAELVQLIEQLEELPRGMHPIPGLRYLVRRLDGTRHPSSGAPAIAWTGVGYIEFMESAFRSASVDDLQRLILHETAHFLWAHLFSEALRADWIELGGWSPDASDRDGWSTTAQTEFVSAYAHAQSANEDMAESISHYVMNPDRLRSRSPAKYAFLRDRVMQGGAYVARIRDDLTFQVYNLDPDYVYPGKIRRVDIRVDGELEGDKSVTVEIEIHALGAASGGARGASMRISSEIGTYVDVRLKPRDGSATVLRGRFELSRYAKRGFWTTGQIVLRDGVGNERYSGAREFGWELFVDNPLEDIEEPHYVAGTVGLHVTSGERSRRPVQLVRAEWLVDENRQMRPSSPCFASLLPEGAQSLEAYGGMDGDSGWCVVEWVITDHLPSGEYVLNYLSMTDAAGSRSAAYFTGQAGEEAAPYVVIYTRDPDSSPPELDLASINASAEPTQPEAPNGETRVSVIYVVRDDQSGLGRVSYKLRDPQGIDHNAYHYHENYYTRFFEGDPRAWRIYEIDTLLPVGSAPGTWGLSSMSVADKAGNARKYDFVEIAHFDVE
jgi:hypothetical protein